MSSGSFDVDVPHFCGEVIHVKINWSNTPGVHTLPNGDPGYPDEYDEERIYTSHEKDYDFVKCPGCGVDLDYDDLFQANVTKAADKQYADSEYDPGDEIDYDPDEVERDLWESDVEFHRSDEMPF